MPAIAASTATVNSNHRGRNRNRYIAVDGIVVPMTPGAGPTGSTRNPSPSRPLIIYDGDCAFCSSTIRTMERRIGRMPSAIPYQFADLDALGLTADQCVTAVQWLGVDGRPLAAHDAIAALFRHAGKGWRVLGVTMQVPGVRQLCGVLYRWIARNRHRLPGGTPACAMPDRSNTAAR